MQIQIISVNPLNFTIGFFGTQAPYFYYPALFSVLRTVDRIGDTLPPLQLQFFLYFFTRMTLRSSLAVKGISASIIMGNQAISGRLVLSNIAFTFGI